ncbi:oncostatin-M-specific receptor subunit beta [Columba guinea]|nr:oncostatin-M-specific receptor subunit beta [Columba guinea]
MEAVTHAAGGTMYLFVTCHIGPIESTVFPVTYLNVSKELAFQRLLVEWDVGKSAHDAELPMSFEIQVRRTGETTTVWTEFHNVTLDKSGDPLHWIWDSDLPLECMSHSVRIRSKAEASKIWSLDTSNDSGPQIFPNEKIVEEGSDITLCCIGRKAHVIEEFSLYPAPHVFNHTNSQIGLLTLKNVAHQAVPHITVYCRESCTEEECYDHAVLFVGSQQRIYNITMTVENPLGKKTATDVFDVTHRTNSDFPLAVYPAAPFQLWEECRDTEITLYWKYQNKGFELFCQTEVVQPDGKVELHNSSDSHLHHASITLSGLQPYTEYTARVHCAAAQHFWRWSEWSEAQTIRTMEATPSGKLDIWREITQVQGGRNVTLFWKQAPGFRANGGSISYEVTWEKEEGGSKLERMSFSSACNSTRISIDNHSYRVSIMAKNDVNYSLPSVLIIPRGTEKELSGSELQEEQINGTDDGIFISWEPRHMYDSYIIDWCNFPTLQPCDLQWKRFRPNTSSALINSAAFVPGVRYNFRIYGSVGNRVSLLKKKTGYLRELPPLFDPKVEKVELTFNAVTLSWDSYPTNESQSGFVRGYHVYVSPIQEVCSLQGSKKHVLPANMLYLLVLLVIVPSLVAAICRWKLNWVKECCCPVIPSPNKSKVLSFKEFKKDELSNIDFYCNTQNPYAGSREALSKHKPCQEVNRDLRDAPEPGENSSTVTAQPELSFTYKVTPASSCPKSRIPRPGHRLRRGNNSFISH